jgi:hypothetical protein
VAGGPEAERRDALLHAIAALNDTPRSPSVGLGISAMLAASSQWVAERDPSHKDVFGLIDPLTFEHSLRVSDDGTRFEALTNGAVRQRQSRSLQAVRDLLMATDEREPTNGNEGDHR